MPKLVTAFGGTETLQAFPEERPEPVRLEFPILSLNPGLRQRCMAPDVWPTLSRA